MRKDSPKIKISKIWSNLNWNLLIVWINMQLKLHWFLLNRFWKNKEILFLINWSTVMGPPKSVHIFYPGSFESAPCRTSFLRYTLIQSNLLPVRASFLEARISCLQKGGTGWNLFDWCVQSTHLLKKKRGSFALKFLTPFRACFVRVSKHARAEGDKKQGSLISQNNGI